MTNARSASADGQGFHSYWEPVGSAAINPSHRSTVSTIAYSTRFVTLTGAVTLAVHIQPRYLLGTVQASDCNGNSFGDLGAPVGADALSKPAIAVDAKSSLAIVVVAAKLGAEWKLFARWHSVTELDSCIGWSSWEEIPRLLGMQPFLATTAPTVTFDPLGRALVQTTKPALVETVGTGPGSWGTWFTVSDLMCGTAGAFTHPATVVRSASDRIYTVLPAISSIQNAIGLVVRRFPIVSGAITGTVPLIRRNAVGDLESFQVGQDPSKSAACTAIVADKFNGDPTDLWIACRADDNGLIYAHRVISSVVEQAIATPLTPFCSNNVEPYSTLDGFTPWLPVPTTSNGDSGVGHFTFASYPGIYAADLFSGSNLGGFDFTYLLRSFRAFEVDPSFPPNGFEYTWGVMQ